MGGCASSNALPTATADASPGKLEPKEEPKQQQETAQAPAQETSGLVPGSGRIEPRPTAEGDTVTAVEEVKAVPQAADTQALQQTPMDAPPANHDASRTPMRSHDAANGATPGALPARPHGSMTPAAAASPQMNMLGSVMQGSMAPHAGSVAFHTGQQYALTPGDARLVAASSMSMRPAASTRAEGDETMGQLDPTQVSSVQPNPLRPGAASAAHAPIDSRSQRAPTSSATSAAAIPTTPQVVDGVPVLVVTDYAGATIASTLSSRRKVERMALWLDQTLRSRLALPGRRWTDPQLLGAQPRQPPAGLPAPPPQPPQQYQQAPHHQQQVPQQQYQPQPQYHHAQPQPMPQPQPQQQMAHHAMYAAPHAQHAQPHRVVAPVAGAGQPVVSAPEA